MPECRAYATKLEWQIVVIYNESEYPKKMSLLDDIHAGAMDIVLVNNFRDLSHEKSEVLTLYEEMRTAGIHLYDKENGDFESLLQEDERFINFISRLDSTLRPQ